MYYTNYIRYIKKSDAKFFINQQYKLIALIYFSIIVMMAILSLIVVPELTDLYVEIENAHPLLLKIYPYGLSILSVIGLLIAFNFLLKKVDEKHLSNKLIAYKNDEMILSNQVLDMKSAYLAIGYGLVFISYVTISLILPIYLAGR